MCPLFLARNDHLHLVVLTFGLRSHIDLAKGRGVFCLG